jgi:hypothetical protein
MATVTRAKTIKIALMKKSAENMFSFREPGLFPTLCFYSTLLIVVGHEYKISGPLLIRNEPDILPV